MFKWNKFRLKRILELKLLEEVLLIFRLQTKDLRIRECLQMKFHQGLERNLSWQSCLQDEIQCRALFLRGTLCIKTVILKNLS
jgi:hypothetical protein